MAQESKIKEFPDISNKLTAPTKKSIFEKQKAEAEAKRQREQEETAAVYEEFVKSFDDADDGSPGTKPGFGAGGTLGFAGAPGGPSRRHFSGPPTGPNIRGGLGGGRGLSGPGSLGPPPSSLSRKRAYDGTPSSNRDSGPGLFAYEDTLAGPKDAKVAFQHSDDEDEKAAHSRAQERVVPKPTVHLSSLPPGTSPAVIKSILPANLKVEAVRILPPSGPGNTERRSFSAIVTLAKDTPAIDIDTAVSALQNKYLGWGFYLSLSRHLSSATVGSGMPAPLGGSSASSLPFGAKPVPIDIGNNFSRGPQTGGHRGGFAPPTSYTPAGPGQFGRGPPPVQVNVAPPSDLKQVKLIHKTLEALLTHGPEFEALLMSRGVVQKEEKWAWLWDPRSPGGVWYRWRLWDILTGAQRRIKVGRGRNIDYSQQIFDGGAMWATPERALLFEYTNSIDEFVSDSDYNSSEDEDSGDEGRRRHQHYQGGAPPPEGMLGSIDPEAQAYLNPLQKAKLVHLLARLPSTNAKLRRGDVARVTAFAIQHAGEGADEVVDLITSNVHHPFAFSSANPDRASAPGDREPKPDSEENADEEKKMKEKEDTSSSKLIGLYIISDILSSSSTSGVRHAWRYRQLFEAALRAKKTLEHLGRLEKELSWGRLRAEKWKRSVQSILGLWEGWCVFPAAAQEHFTTVFNNPPLTPAEEAAVAEVEKAAATLAAKSKWKTVEEKAKEAKAKANPVHVEETIDADVDGEAMAEDDDVDGQPMSDNGGDIDGEPMEEVDGEAMIEDEDGAEEGNDERRASGQGGDKFGRIPQQRAGTELSVEDRKQPNNTAAESPEKAIQAGRRRRPKAEDMFADSDGE